jgi:predicted  nucleic acid-binding Zn-ribbon protein
VRILLGARGKNQRNPTITIKLNQMSKITDEQLEKLHKQQTALNSLLNKIGIVESQKHALLHEIAGVNQEIEEFKAELEKEYGSVNINLQTGEYSKIEENEADKED